MTDDSKAVVWDAVYKPFGEVVSITGAASNNLRFPGQYFLIESGLHYNLYRHYDPTLGRYTQPDPRPNAIDLGSARSGELVPSELVAHPGNSTGNGGDELVSGLIGVELPEFVDGSSLYAYARSSPAVAADPNGLQLRILGPSAGVWYGNGRLCASYVMATALDWIFILIRVVPMFTFTVGRLMGRVGVCIVPGTLLGEAIEVGNALSS